MCWAWVLNLYMVGECLLCAFPGYFLPYAPPRDSKRAAVQANVSESSSWQAWYRRQGCDRTAHLPQQKV